ncbi:hypothetical protein [Tepidibacillus fermentans]|nr:hypothetical protein [Tepidibacillus fermentans]
MFRDDEYALHMEFDHDGAIELKTKFQEALINGHSCIRVHNSSLDSMKKVKEIKITNCGQPSEMYYNSEILTLELDKDIIDFCIVRFNACINHKDFFPAEICDVDYENTELTIYGIYMEVK